MFSKILIANRGEIARRVIRTARRLGIATVAVHSDIDRGALFVAEADEAIAIGGKAAIESYLDSAKILDAARACAAEAVHPGYGFLAEDSDFAEACAGAGLVFVGPPVAAIRAMGSKSEARALMTGAGVPVVPGFADSGSDDAALNDRAAELGWPVLIKPVLGGGGKGMRRVEGAGDFQESLAAARREAVAAFGNGEVLVEKFIDRPRHVEVQVFADTYGNAVHLFDRDCSFQRRHQKIIEEAPAPGLGDDLRARMAEAALAAVRAAGYVNAGTVEFIVTRGKDGAEAFYFLEMNTRLQVEHAVTEMISGLDLVEWQLRIAAGEALPLAQPDIESRGHAIEARLYAETPEQGFLPSTGRLRRLRFPEESDDLRIDSGVRAGDLVSPHYDPMLAKIIAHAASRDQALAVLRPALAAISVRGVRTNLLFLGALCRDRRFIAAGIDTHMVDREGETLIPGHAAASDQAIALAVLFEHLGRAAQRSGSGPWAASSAWRLNGAPSWHWLADGGEAAAGVVLERKGAGWRVKIEDRELVVEDVSVVVGGVIAAKLDGSPVQATVLSAGDRRAVLGAGLPALVRFADPVAVSAAADSAAGTVVAPMPGTIIKLIAREGEHVPGGAALAIVEAMKMEHTVCAAAAGRVRAFHYAEGETVEEGAVLVDFEADEETP
ncbi:MAG TPA: biotin carboxylase N-terminal domain-containing protein [Alphaproteobacteria bacterium]|nr:biotin carboxylase N-terminal domain-containing protein [Alphaproteobacteria bacterium]